MKIIEDIFSRDTFNISLILYYYENDINSFNKNLILTNKKL